MNRTFFRVLTAGILLGLFMQCKGQKDSAKMRYSQSGLQSALAEIDSLDRIGLYKSAQPLADDLLQRAVAANDPVTAVGAMRYKIKFAGHLDTEADRKIWPDYLSAIESAQFPTSNVLAAAAANYLWGYYHNYHWQIIQRKSNAESDDIRLWSTDDFVRNTGEMYDRALTNPDGLFEMNWQHVESIITGDSTNCAAHTTLLDLLMEEATAFYLSIEANISPLQQSVDNPIDLLKDNPTFLRIVPTKIPGSNWHKAIILWQQLTELHTKSEDQQGLAAITVARLGHFSRLPQIIDSDAAYLSALENTEQSLSSPLAKARVSLALAEFYESRGSSYSENGVDEKNRWYYVEALRRCNEIMALDDCPEHLCRPCEAISSRIQRMELNFITEKIILPGKSWRSLINYRNIEECYYLVVPFDYDEYRDIMNIYDRSKQIERITQHAQLRDLHHRIPLNDDGDFRRHGYEIAHEPLMPGFYLLIASPTRVVSFERTAVAINPIWVSNIAWVHRQNADRSNSFRFVQRETGVALSEITVEVYEENYHAYQKKTDRKRIETLKTDSSGEIHIAPDQKDRRIQLKAIAGNQSVWVDQSFYQSAPRSPQPPYTHVRFYTDRNVYRPGQTVHFKGIAIQHDGEKRELHTGLEETVFLYDVNSQVVDKMSLITNEFGSYHGSFQLPETGITGSYYIQTSRGSHYFSVEEYKRPTFSVEIHPTDSAFELGQSVRITGEAQSLAGFPLSQIDVNYRVVRTTERFFWGRGGWPQPGAGQEIAAGKATTDENGVFGLRFMANPPAQAYFPYEHYRFEIEVDAIDVSGESQSAKRSIRMGKIPLVLGADLPQTILSDDLTQPIVTALNLDGDPVPAEGVAKIYRLKMPDKPLRNRLWKTPDQHQLDSTKFHEIFPHDVYREATGIDQASKAEVVFEVAFNTSESNTLNISSTEDWKAGWYLLRLESELPGGEKAEYEQRFTWINSKDKHPLPADFLWSHSSAEKAEPGDMITVHLSSAVNLKAILEVEINEEITWRREINLNNERKAIEIPVTEECRGNFGIHIHAVYNNRIYNESHIINVPYSNKELKVEMDSFRDQLLPGSKEKWTVKITGPDGAPFGAELLAGMYDASLDALGFSNHWDLNPYVMRRPSAVWKSQGFAQGGGWQFESDWNRIERYFSPSPCRLNLGFMPGHTRFAGYAGIEMAMMSEDSEDTKMAVEQVSEQQVAEPHVLEDLADLPVPLRSNFNETAFFFPVASTDEKGRAVLEFTLPESLTTWKWMLLAHGRKLEIGSANGKSIASKPLMVIPNPPRFLRQGDQFTWAAQVVNQGEEEMKVEVNLKFADFKTGRDLTNDILVGSAKIEHKLLPGERKRVEWQVMIPESTGLIDVILTASSEGFTDGERRTLPVLSNRTFVTETMPFALFGKGEETFVMENLKNWTAESGIVHHGVTLEFSANPTWYAVQALPYMMEYPHECSEQIFSRFYANALAGHIVQSKPAIAEMFKRYAEESPEALWSNLEKNQELKQVLLEETPWVLNAQSETESKQRIAMLFELDRMQKEQKTALRKLAEAQLPDGSWPWFKGMRSDRYITQYIIEGMGRLRHLGIDISENGADEMITKALRFLDKAVVEAHDHKDTLLNEQISNLDIQYLYLNSFYPVHKHGKSVQQTIEHIWALAESQWVDRGLHTQALLAITAHRDGREKLHKMIEASITERSIFEKNKGRFWITPSGFMWHQRPVETHSALIEMYAETDAPKQWINEMRYWLLSQKQVQHWKTTTATANACYAMLIRGDDWLEMKEWPEISVGNYDIKYFEALVSDATKVVSPEPGSGHFKTNWEAKNIDVELAEVQVVNKHDGPAWKALYWQYFQDIDKVESHSTVMHLDREILVARVTDGKTSYVPHDGNTPQPGDRILVRLIIETDRTMDYVHLSDRRAAGLEPVDVRSGYQYNSGLGYYVAVKDAAQHFFFSRLPEGRHVLEYELRANLKGNFSHGFSEIQSMYAPEFSAKTKGLRVEVE